MVDCSWWVIQFVTERFYGFPANSALRLHQRALGVLAARSLMLRAICEDLPFPYPCEFLELN